MIRLLQAGPNPRRSALLAGVGLVALLLAALRPVVVIDDAFIFFRYAHNLAGGHGYVFNPGQPVEGTTSVIWTVLLALLDALRVELPWAAQALGLACVLLLLLLVGLAHPGLPASPVALGLVLLLLLSARPFLPSMMLGLETGLYALALVALLATARRPPASRAEAACLAALGLLLFLTRPEGLGLLLALGLALLPQVSRPPVRLALALLVLGVLGVTLWRLASFGDYLPNSLQAKSVLAFASLEREVVWARLQAGGRYLGGLLAAWPLLGLGLIGLLTVGLRTLPGLLAVAALLLGVAVVLVGSGDWMPFYRLLTPYMAVLAWLAVPGAQWLIDRAPPPGRLWLKWAYGAAALLSVASAVVSLSRQPPMRAELNDCYAQSAAALLPVLGPHTLVAAESIGVLGYELPDVPILDLFGLTEPYIAHNGGVPVATYTMGKHHYQYVMDRQPDLFIFHGDPTNHIPYLNRLGYAQQYHTLHVQLKPKGCSLMIGTRTDQADLSEALVAQRFIVQPMEVDRLAPNPWADWPLGQY